MPIRDSDWDFRVEPRAVEAQEPAYDDAGSLTLNGYLFCLVVTVVGLGAAFYAGYTMGEKNAVEAESE